MFYYHHDSNTSPANQVALYSVLHHVETTVRTWRVGTQTRTSNYPQTPSLVWFCLLRRQTSGASLSLTKWLKVSLVHKTLQLSVLNFIVFILSISLKKQLSIAVRFQVLWTSYVETSEQNLPQSQHILIQRFVHPETEVLFLSCIPDVIYHQVTLIAMYSYHLQLQ